MMEKLVVHKVNNVHLKVQCDAGIAYELNEYFTFNVPGAKFSPAYKNKLWDGKIRLFHLMRQTLYFGLIDELRQFANDRGYQLDYEEPRDFADTDFSVTEAEQFIKELGLPYDIRDYQLKAFIHAIRKDRALFVSPTASGKSLIIYTILSYYMREMYNCKFLVIVPTTGLVHQMASDFVSYGCSEDKIHKIYSGQEKDTDQPIVVTTWQSIYKMPRDWFDQFGVIIGDEAHQFKAKSLVDIMEKSTTVPFKFGFTGTLDGTQTNKLVLQGLFGGVEYVTTTAELMEAKTVANLSIKTLILNYEQEARKTFSKTKPQYADELTHIVSHVQRNKFLANLTTSLKNNTLLLFNYVDHGKYLYDLIKTQAQGRNVFLVYGNVEGEEREEIRNFVNNNDSSIIVASYKTFSTGINIPNLHNVIFASPSKSRIRVLQSIGRTLRLSEDKQNATLYDIADDLSWKSYQNHTIKHLAERIRMYNDEKFNYKIYNINIREA